MPLMLGIADKLEAQIQELYPDQLPQLKQYRRYVRYTGCYNGVMYGAYSREKLRRAPNRRSGGAAAGRPLAEAAVSPAEAAADPLKITECDKEEHDGTVSQERSLPGMRGEVKGLFHKKIGGKKALCKDCSAQVSMAKELLKDATPEFIKEHLEYRRRMP